ncbi:hypothetical protein [uncultured Sanguibacteroides sp.]|uniref:hypothetical protein n=1 Tax=uncultured Sanguibacteroides sp. TaxID=1635151 RepID=UPI0025EB8053|nr:hypothetical protein [uncultured Sanguibacteroides sp.]
MKKPVHVIYDILIVLVILILVDCGVGRIGSCLISQLEESSFYGEINNSLNSITPDVLIIGASTAKSDVVPQLIMDSLGISAYNAGSDGKNILYHSCVGNAVINRKPPEVIICVLFPFEFQHNLNDRLSVLNPFYDRDSLIHATVNLKSPAEWIKMKSNLYRYNSKILTIISNKFQKKDSSKSFGYRALPIVTPYPELKRIESGADYFVDSVSVKRFVDFVRLCKEKKIHLITVISPYYGIYDEGESSIPIISKICSQEDIVFLDYSQDKYFLDHPEMFKDQSHLNHHGAERYTGILINNLRDVLYPVENSENNNL